MLKFLQSFRYAITGIWNGFMGERNMRVHLLATVVVIACGLYFSISAMEWCIIALCIGAVLAAELFNSAIELLTDLVKPEQHPVAGKIKDAAAGAVLVIALAAFVCGVLIFLKYFSSALK